MTPHDLRIKNILYLGVRALVEGDEVQMRETATAMQHELARCEEEGCGCGEEKR